MSQRSPILIIGGGICGAFSAYFLSRLGIANTLIERHDIGEHASGNNPGGLNPMHGTGVPGPMLPLTQAAFRLHLDHWPALRELSGVDFAASCAPRIHLVLDPTDRPALERIHDLHQHTPGFSARWMDRAVLLSQEPRLNPALEGALWTAGNAKVAPRAYTRAIAAAAVRLGTTLLHGTVHGVESHGDRVIAARVDADTIACDGVVVATGAWASEAVQWLGQPLPVAPIKGELLEVEVDGPAIRDQYAWRAAAVYGTGSSTVWLGGTEAHAGLDATPTATARASLLQGATHLFPRLVIARVLKHTAALRPVSQDDLPIIGWAPGWSNVCLTLGGGRKGMLLSSAMGLAAAELFQHGATSLPIAPCAPARFLSANETQP